MIQSLYSVPVDVWHRFLAGDPYFGSSCDVVTAELTDAIGGGNILTIDCGDDLWIAIPCPGQLHPNAVLCLLIEHPDQSEDDLPIYALWRVRHWGVYPLIGTLDAALTLSRSMTTFLTYTLEQIDAPLTTEG